MYTEEKIVLEKLFNLSSQLSFTKQTMLYLIGLGLSYESDITVRDWRQLRNVRGVPRGIHLNFDGSQPGVIGKVLRQRNHIG